MIGLEIASVIVGICALILGGFMLFRFLILYLSNKKFERMSRETTAVIVARKAYHPTSNIVSYVPIVEYYDEFQTSTVRRAIESIVKIHFPKGNFPTNPIKVQYTEKRVRIADERYVNINSYSGRREGIISIICTIVVFICFIVLVSSIIS